MVCVFVGSAPEFEFKDGNVIVTFNDPDIQPMCFPIPAYRLAVMRALQALEEYELARGAVVRFRVEGKA